MQPGQVVVCRCGTGVSWNSHPHAVLLTPGANVLYLFFMQIETIGEAYRNGWRITARNLDVETTTLFFTMGVVYAMVPAAALAVGLYAIADALAAWRTLSGGTKDPR